MWSGKPQPWEDGDENSTLFPHLFLLTISFLHSLIQIFMFLVSNWINDCHYVFSFFPAVVTFWDLVTIKNCKSRPSFGPDRDCLSSCLKAKCLALEGQMLGGCWQTFTCCLVKWHTEHESHLAQR